MLRGGNVWSKNKQIKIKQTSTELRKNLKNKALNIPITLWQKSCSLLSTLTLVVYKGHPPWVRFVAGTIERRWPRHYGPRASRWAERSARQSARLSPGWRVAAVWARGTRHRPLSHTPSSGHTSSHSPVGTSCTQSWCCGPQTCTLEHRTSR